jgi:hypothetical protein
MRVTVPQTLNISYDDVTFDFNLAIFLFSHLRRGRKKSEGFYQLEKKILKGTHIPMNSQMSSLQWYLFE